MSTRDGAAFHGIDFVCVGNDDDDDNDGLITHKRRRGKKYSNLKCKFGSLRFLHFH